MKTKCKNDCEYYNNGKCFASSDIKYEDLIVCKPDNFNGVLFILREPHKYENQSSEEAVSGNKNWWGKICSAAGETGKETAYTNRFHEYLNALECLNAICENDNDLSKAALANINPYGGEEKASECYREISQDEKYNRIEHILREVRPKYIFMCSDIYNALKNNIGNEPEENNGVKYNSNKRRQYKSLTLTFENQKIRCFEIIHPCISPKIVEIEK